MFPRIVDITSITGQGAAGPPTSWQTQNGPFNVEHLAAVNANHELLVFWWSPQHDWQSVNVSAKTGQRIVGDLTSWQTRNGPFLVEHLAGRTANGDLIVFWWSPQHDWQAVNVSAKTGKRVSTAPTSWVTPDGAGGTVEHLAALGVARELLVFYWTPARDWQVVDVTAKTGKTVVGEVTSWISRNGAMLVEHLAGPAPDGSLEVFWWSPAHDWQAIDASAIAGGRAAGRPVSWMTGNVEHVAVRGTDNRLFVYWWTSATNWRLVDVTAITGVPLSDVSSVFQLADGGENVEILTGRGVDGSLLQYWWTPSRDWQARNLSHATGVAWASDFTSWTTPSGSRIIEHAAGATPQGRLVLAWDDGEARRLTDAAGEPLAPLVRTRGRRQVVAILWDPQRPTDPAPSVAAVDSVIFGPTSSARDHFVQNSGGNFTIEREGVLGWFPASKPADYWWGSPDTNDTDGDGWVNPHVQKWAEAVRLANPQFNFKAYDTNAFDGNLRPDELGVLIVIPQNGPFGTNRGVVGREYPNPQPLVVDGVTIGTIAETYIGAPPNLGVVAHELGHLFMKLPDMYFDLPNEPRWAGIPFDNPFAAGAFSLMDATYNGAHFDPFLKLKLGWLRPQIICRSGRYTLRAIEDHREAWILMEPQRSTREYFIVENRWPGSSYDAPLPDRGLGVWHVIEDPQIYGTYIPPRPPNAPPASRQDLWEQKWATVSLADWGRRGIRMIRPVWDTHRPSQSLWDGSDPATGYDLLPDAAPPLASLRWADGTPSGFAMRNISAAGPTMTADLQVPW
jgi:M6 family metalloprotease-like protein